MHLVKTLCACAVAAALVATPATADFIQFELTSEGTASLDGNTVTMTGSVLSQDPVAIGFETISLQMNLSGFGFVETVTGLFVLSSGQGELLALFKGLIFGINAPNSSYSGIFLAVAGTGAYENLKGIGTFSGFTNNATGHTTFSLGGILVPAPGALCLLAFAGVLGKRRRRHT